MQTRKQNRLVNYDYSTPGYYFVTACVQNRTCCFGNIVNNKIILNNLGKIIEQAWADTPNHYQNATIDPVYIIMPNHFHGIVIITPPRADEIRPYTSLNTIIGSFKRKASNLIHQSGFPNFQWQKSFFDHVIRKDESLEKIREYIQNNPLKWELDKNNPSNLWM